MTVEILKAKSTWVATQSAGFRDIVSNDTLSFENLVSREQVPSASTLGKIWGWEDEYFDLMKRIAPALRSIRRLESDVEKLGEDQHYGKLSGMVCAETFRTCQSKGGRFRLETHICRLICCGVSPSEREASKPTARNNIPSLGLSHEQQATAHIWGGGCDGHGLCEPRSPRERNLGTMRVHF